ncbi:hypothetical protein [Pseudokineococcus sp. 1T1Z-3]|uniref:hypothetical protein n=1 Tax=Pseudokineococcus sp. 1T1Z-3 TaxID=3132745 RepID=UPI00309968E6
MSTTDPWAAPTPDARPGERPPEAGAQGGPPAGHGRTMTGPVAAGGRRRWPLVLALVAGVLVLLGLLAAALWGVARAADALAGEGGFLGVEEGEAYGDNPVLDAYWDDCEAGDGIACDDLYYSSGTGTEYEDFGWTCGGRLSGSAASGWCEDEDLEALAPAREGSRYGDDDVLDRLWDRCGEGDGVACDELYATAEPGSDYEDFGLTCGDRYSALRAPEFCAEALR